VAAHTISINGEGFSQGTIRPGGKRIQGVVVSGAFCQVERDGNRRFDMVVWEGAEGACRYVAWPIRGENMG